jgi:hypothetical protein
MSDVLDRFLRYVRYDTQSDETVDHVPSTDKQLILLRRLTDELRAIGLADASIDEYGYVMATSRRPRRKPASRRSGFSRTSIRRRKCQAPVSSPIVHRALRRP